MPISVLGGEVGEFLTVACNVLAGHQDAIAVGKFVTWNAAANMQVNSAADAANVQTLGVVAGLNNDSSVATVKWLGWKQIAEFTYSTAPVRGSSVETETANGSKVSGSSNTTLALDNLVVAIDHVSGKCLVAIR